MNLINNLVNRKKLKFNYNNIPTAFSNPNLACIGYSEDEAKKYKKIHVLKLILNL